MLNVAVIGIGSMGKNHARIYSELGNVNLVAVSDIDKKLVENISRKYKCKYYTDYKKMLNEEKIDIVSIVVPTEHHKQIAFDVIEKITETFKDKVFVGIRGGMGRLEDLSWEEIHNRTWEIKSEQRSNEWIPGSQFLQVIKTKSHDK